MEKQLENVSVMQDILRDSMTGLWGVELNEGEAPRLYADETFRSIMGMKADLSPEECFRFWKAHVREGDFPRIEAALREMTEGLYTEVLYAWEHPEKGTIYIRCGGRRDPSYTEGFRLRGSNQDVSKVARVRLEIERKLEEREQEYKQLSLAIERDQDILNAIPGGVGVIHCTPEGTWVPEFLSEGFAAMTRMPLEEAWTLYRQDAMTGVHPEDKETLTRKMNDYFTGDKEYTELIYRLKKGEEGYIWVRNALTMIQGEDGSKKVYCVYLDISQELEEREALRRQYDERLAQHYRAAGPDVLLMGHSNVSRNQVLEIVDRSGADLLKLFGQERDSFTVGLANFVVKEEERQTFIDTFLNVPALSAYAEGRTELKQTCLIRLPQDLYGRYAQFKVHLVPSPDSGEVMGILTVTDVTEQIIVRKILGKLSMLGCDQVVDVDLFQDRMIPLTVDGLEAVSSGKNQFSTFKELWLKECVIPRDQELVRKMLDRDYMLQRLQKEGAYAFPYTLTDQGGEVRAKKLTVSAIDLQLGRVCLARVDMTDAMEEERRNREALEEALDMAQKASQAKSDFLSSMSHDIRTPMNAIIGMTALAESYIGDRDRLKDCLKKISMSSQHMLSLVNDILDMSKLEQYQMKLSREVLHICDGVQQIADMLRPQAEAAGLHFTVWEQNIHRQTFYGDASRISQILINLLGNAIKFTPEGGRVSLVVEEVPALGEGERVRYRFTVEDNGIGMSEEFQPHVFEAFARDGNAAYIEGTGLGLSIVKGLVELMNGTISLESKKEKGTTFRVELEFDAAEDSAAPVPAEKQNTLQEEAEPLAGYRFLAAEDNGLNAEILEELLALKGASLDVGENGALAVEMFRTAAPGTYHAILMDIQMPEMNGLEAARAIRAMERADATTIPIVAMTANAFAEDVQAALEAGMNAHVSKPIDLENVVRLLKNLIATE